MTQMHPACGGLINLVNGWNSIYKVTAKPIPSHSQPLIRWNFPKFNQNINNNIQNLNKISQNFNKNI